MNILILGAGQVGSTLAENLASDKYDITVVDASEQQLDILRTKLDIKTVTGFAASPSVLKRAGCEDADMIIAVTSDDEVNMVACQIAWALFNTTLKIARIRSADIQQQKSLFEEGHRHFAFNIDTVICPEDVVTDYIKQLVLIPEALQVVEFAQGRVKLVAVKAIKGGPLVGQPIATIRQHIPGIDCRVAAIYRQDHPIPPNANTVIEADDEVFLVADSRHIRKVMGELRHLEKPIRNVMIAGGGNIGEKLTVALCNRYRIKLIEFDRDRAEYLSTHAPIGKSIVISGSATDRDMLINENIQHMDVFCAVTNNDQTNVFAALLAKKLGVRKVIALINNSTFVELTEGGDIDVAVSPQLSTTSALLSQIRQGEVTSIHRLRRGAAEALEGVALGDSTNSRLVGRMVQDIHLPEGTSIGAIVRDNEVIIAHHDTLIMPGDHIIIFTVNKAMVRQIEELFAVDGIFFAP
jgi:trk system potassium uptake protein TrkA